MKTSEENSITNNLKLSGRPKQAQKSKGKSTYEESSVCKINSQIFLILILLFLRVNVILSVAAKVKKSKDFMKFKKMF